MGNIIGHPILSVPGDLVSTVQATAQSAADQNAIVPAYEAKGDGYIDKVKQPGQVCHVDT